MAGGTWNAQNKVRPGVYIRFKTATAAGLTVGDRGVAAICEPLSWGPVGQVMTVEAGADMTAFTGYDITAPQTRFLREIFRGTNRTAGPKTLLLYRPAADDAAAASVTVGALSAAARYPGVRGNDISIAVTASETAEGSFLVSTIVDGDIVDRQTVADIAALAANDWVSFSGSGAPTATTGQPLTGGADGRAKSAAYLDFLSAIEPYPFDILIYDGEDASVREAMVAFVKRLADDNGQYAQLVASGIANPDSRLVIDVESGVTLADGTALAPREVTWWLGGAQAGAAYNQSLTYAVYPDAVAVSPMLTSSRIAAATQAGKVVLFADDGVVRIEQDINSLVTFTTDIGKSFRKNRVMRVCNTIARDIWSQFSQNFIGVVNNDAPGRAQFKTAIVGYLLELQAGGGIRDFSPDDVTVEAGSEIDAIVVTIALKPVDSVEKIYMTIEVS